MKDIIGIMLPILPEISYKEPIVRSLSFLTSQYQLDFFDPVAMEPKLQTSRDFFDYWRLAISKRKDIKLWFGFSLGGVILQQCFSQGLTPNAKVILFSSPTNPSEALKAKLKTIIALCEAGKLEEAIGQLYRDPYKISDNASALQRLLFGLKLVVNPTEALQGFTLPHLHFIGANSALVTEEDVHSRHAELVVVPNAGMRVLEDNAPFCQQRIWQKLHETD